MFVSHQWTGDDGWEVLCREFLHGMGLPLRLAIVAGWLEVEARNPKS